MGSDDSEATSLSDRRHADTWRGDEISAAADDDNDIVGGDNGDGDVSNIIGIPHKQATNTDSGDSGLSGRLSALLAVMAVTTNDLTRRATSNGSGESHCGQKEPESFV